jgi:hypothetical protein
MKRSLLSLAAMGLLLTWYVWQRAHTHSRQFSRDAELERWEDEGGAAGSRGSVR